MKVSVEITPEAVNGETDRVARVLLADIHDGFR